MKTTKFAALAAVVGLSLAQSAQAGSWTHETLAGMPVDIYTPTTAPALDGQRALMLSLGGCGQQAETNTEFKDQSNWESTADKYGMIVAIPKAPNGGVLWAGCWDYYNADHTRSNRHNDNLINLAQTLKARSSLNIDPDQVYISGLSSGGGITMVMACLAPDIFAGVGNSAGPALGTSSNETNQVATNASEVRDVCVALAGSNAPYLETQLTSIVWGSSDYLAAPGYADVNADAMAMVYGASKNAGTRTVEGESLDGTEVTYSDAQGLRVSRIMIDGLSHAWPAGGGSGQSQYMDNTSINYPAELSCFLFKNNRRTDSVYADDCRGGVQPPPPPPGETSDCWTTSNAEHAAAGRATAYGEAHYAKGSWNYLGYGSGIVTSVKEVSSGRYEKVSSCQ